MRKVAAVVVLAFVVMVPVEAAEAKTRSCKFSNDASFPSIVGLKAKGTSCGQAQGVARTVEWRFEDSGRWARKLQVQRPGSHRFRSWRCSYRTVRVRGEGTTQMSFSCRRGRVRVTARLAS